MPSLSRSLLLLIPTQQSPNPFQLPKNPRQLPHHALEACKVLLFLQHNTDIEDIFIPIVPRRVDNADGVADDAVAGGGHRDEAVTEFLRGDQVGGDAVEVEEGARESRMRGGEDGAFGDLVGDDGS